MSDRIHDAGSATSSPRERDGVPSLGPTQRGTFSLARSPGQTPGPKERDDVPCNIGFHHIHHLSPAIPDYNPERCYEEGALFQQVEPVTLWRSLKSLSFRLWVERRRELVGYGRLRAIRREASSPLAGGRLDPGGPD